MGDPSSVMSVPRLAVLPPADLERVQTVAALVIQSAAAERDAVDGLAFVQGVKRSLERARKELVDPLNAKVKEVNASFKALLDPVEQAEQRVKGAILDWRRREAARIETEQRRIREENDRREREARAEQERREQEARARERQDRERIEAETRAAAAVAGFNAEEAAELARLEAADVKPVAVAPVEVLRQVVPAALAPTVRSTLGAATVRKVWAFEVTDEAQVPRPYLVVSHAMIRDAVRAGTREIPGVRIFEQEQLAGRAS